MSLEMECGDNFQIEQRLGEGAMASWSIALAPDQVAVAAVLLSSLGSLMCPRRWGRGITLQIHGYQSFYFQVGQEGLHPVEEKAFAAVQYLLPVSLAARGENSRWV